MDPHLGRHTRHQLITIALAGLAAYGGSLLAQPSGGTTHPGAVAIESTAANALDVAGGAEFGSGNVPLVGADGTINGPLSSTILSDLSGANLTTRSIPFWSQCNRRETSHRCRRHRTRRALVLDFHLHIE